MKIAYTIVTPDYLVHAFTLGNSIIQHNPEYKFIICLIGQLDKLKEIETFKKYEIIELSELLDDRILKMHSIYNLFELSCALKPYFAEHIFSIYTNCKRIKYFDSDIVVFNKFNEEIELNNDYSIFLTAHYFKSIHPQNNSFNDTQLLKYGIYNAGFFELSYSEVSFKFLKWWQSYLSNFCFDHKEPYPQLFVDQNLLDLVPIFFTQVYIINDLGYNVSFFNLHERAISIIENKYLINDSHNLIFFHYTGYKYYEHEKCSQYILMNNYENTPYLNEICSYYKDTLLLNGVERFFKLPTLPEKKEMSLQGNVLAKINLYFFKKIGLELSKYKN